MPHPCPAPDAQEFAGERIAVPSAALLTVILSLASWLGIGLGVLWLFG